VGGTWEDLREIINEGHPVIVGWYSDYEEPADEHYSVVSQVSNDFITLLDPEIGEERTISREDFIKRWAHTEPRYWYIEISPAKV
jgi:predicted double-glycine peptidase